MTVSLDGRAAPKRRPGPKPRGRTVIPLTITVTHAQRAELEARADMEKNSISTIVRRFIAAGLAAGGLFGLFILTALIEITIARHPPHGLGNRLEQRNIHDAATRRTDRRRA